MSFSNAYIQNLENCTEEFIYRQQWRNSHREWTYGYGERGAEGEM